MKKLFYTFGLFFLFHAAYCQITVTLQPDAAVGKDALLHGHPNNVNTNMGSATQFVAAAHSAYGYDFTARSVINFDVSFIPDHSNIESAILTLYAIDQATGNVGMGFHQGENQCWIERVTSAWDESSVTWNNQPTTTELNRVGTSKLSQTTDSLVADVKQLIQDILDNKTSSFGLMVKLQTEVKYSLVNFASSDNVNKALRPKLVITYKPSSLILQPNAADGKDALLHGHSTAAATNMGGATQFVAAAHSAYGESFIARSIVEFNLTGIPSNAKIDSAVLTFISIDNATGSVGMGFNQGENQCWIERITTSWDENTVTWNNQPTTTTVNRVGTPVLSDADTLVIINVTPLVQDMVNDPLHSFGFMVKMQTEVKYRLVNFASSDHAEATRHPKLEVYYSTLSATKLVENKNELKVYPNPSNGKFDVMLNSAKNSVINIYTINGQLIKTLKTNSSTEKIDLSDKAKGLYLIQVVTGNQTLTEKVKIQ